MTGQPVPDGRSHDAYRLLAAAAVDGRIDPEDAAALEAHLASCPTCRADERAMLQDHLWLATPGPVREADPRIRAAVLEAARTARVPRLGAPVLRVSWTTLAAAILVIAVAGAGLRILERRDPAAGPAALPTASAPAVPTPSAALGETCVQIPAGLSARWPFDANGINYLPGGLEAELRGTQFVEGVLGSSLHLAAAGQATASVGAPELGAADFTVSLWVRFSSLDGEQVLVERWSHDPLVGWSLTKLATGELRLAVAGDADEVDVETASLVLLPGTWYHVAARRLASTFSILVDGRTVASRTLPDGASADLTAGLPLLFGRRGGGDDRGFQLAGDLDEIMIWAGRALADAEVAELHRAAVDGLCGAWEGYEGSWRATDCASTGDPDVVDCVVWGDRSELRLVIGPGEHPDARFEDVSDAGCGPAGAAGRRTAAGTGAFRGVHLMLTFDDVSCAAPGTSWTNPMDLYIGPGDDALWDDPDGDSLATVWQRE